MSPQHAIDVLRSTFPRRSEVIYADLNARYHFVQQLLNLASDFYARATWPYFLDRDGVHRVGPDPVPATLRDLLTAEQSALALLAVELQIARSQEYERTKDRR